MLTGRTSFSTGYTIDDFTDITWSQFIEKAWRRPLKTWDHFFPYRQAESDLIMIMLQSAGASL